MRHIYLTPELTDNGDVTTLTLGNSKATSQDGSLNDLRAITSSDKTPGGASVADVVGSEATSDSADETGGE